MHMLFISRPKVKDGAWTVQLNRWRTLWDQFTNKLFRVNLFRKPSQSSKLPTEFEPCVFDQLKSLVEGIMNDSYLSLVALQKKKKQEMKWVLQLAFV